jgi:MYXO-CTERM domain-containing protein
MVCYAPTYQECSGGGMGGAPACDAGGGCDAPKEIDAGTFECHDVTGESTCTPRYQLPCHVAADCGAGFACEEQRYTVCSTTAGSGMGGAGGKEDPGVMTPVDAGVVGADGGSYSYECHEEASGSFYCRLLELPCDSDADCGEGLECQRNPYDYDCGGGAAADAGIATGVGGTPATMAAAGSSAENPMDPKAVDVGVGGCVDDGAPAQVCAPHDYDSGGGYPGMGGGSAGSGSGNSGSGGASATDGGVQAPGMGTNEGSAGGTTSGGDSDSSGHGHDQHPAHHHHSAGHLPRLGCSVGAESGSQLASWFGLVGLVAFGLRRRARRA